MALNKLVSQKVINYQSKNKGEKHANQHLLNKTFKAKVWTPLNALNNTSHLVADNNEATNA